MARTISAVARDIIRLHREKASETGKPLPPYLQAYVLPMVSLSEVTDYYGADDGEYVVIYALSNLSHWRHPQAKALKDELKTILHEHNPKRYKAPK